MDGYTHIYIRFVFVKRHYSKLCTIDSLFKWCGMLKWRRFLKLSHTQRRKECNEQSCRQWSIGFYSNQKEILPKMVIWRCVLPIEKKHWFEYVGVTPLLLVWAVHVSGDNFNNRISNETGQRVCDVYCTVHARRTLALKSFGIDTILYQLHWIFFSIFIRTKITEWYEWTCAIVDTLFSCDLNILKKCAFETKHRQISEKSWIQGGKCKAPFNR